MKFQVVTVPTTNAIVLNGPAGPVGPAGSNASATTDASLLTSGTLAYGRLVATVWPTSDPFRTNWPWLDGGMIRISSGPTATVSVNDATAEPGQSIVFTCSTTMFQPTYQWLRNGNAIVEATASTFVMAASLADHNAVYRCVVSNAFSETRNSNQITLSVIEPVYTISSFASDVGTSPSTTRLSVAPGHDCIVIDTGATPMIEPDFFLYVRIGSTTRKIKTGRYSRLIISATPGDAVSFATSDGRNLSCFSSIKPSAMTTPSGTSGVANADRQEPRVWTASAPHITLPAINQSIRVTCPVSGWRDVFVREFDGTNWGQPVWYRLHPTYSGDIVIPCFNRRVAVATQDGSTVAVTAPAGATIGGVSTTYSCITPATGTTRTVTANSESDLRAKMAMSVAGDEIVLPDGVYSLAVAITSSSFPANANSPNGITIRSASGNPTACVIKPVTSTSTPFSLGASTQPFQIKGIEFNLVGCLGGPVFTGTWLRFEDIRLINDKASGINNFDSVGSGAAINNTIFNRVYSFGSANDNLSWFGDGSTQIGPLLIDCWSENAGNVSNAQCLTTHSGMAVRVCGGNFGDANVNVIANGSAVTYCEFTKFFKGSRSSTVVHAGTFGCRSTSINGQRTTGGAVVSGCFAKNDIYDDLTAAIVGPFFANQNELTEGNFVRIPRNRIFLNIAASGNLDPASFNAFVSSGQTTAEGVYVHLYQTTNSTQLKALHNCTFSGCTSAISVGTTAAPLSILTLRNIACRGNTNSINGVSGAATNALINSNYGVYDSASSAAFTQGANSLKDVDAALDSKLIPTEAGNCDATGDPTLHDWIGGRDFCGWPLIYTLGQSSIGARTAVRSSGTLFPNVWSAA